MLGSQTYAFLSAALFLIAKDTIIMFCQTMSIYMYRKDNHYRIETNIIRTKWGNRIKRKYIYICKRNSEIVSGSVIIQNDLIYFSLPSSDTFSIGP